MIPGAAVCAINTSAVGAFGCGALRRRAAGFLAGLRDLRAALRDVRRADAFFAVRRRPRDLLLLLRAFAFVFRLAISNTLSIESSMREQHERRHCATTVD